MIPCDSALFEAALVACAIITPNSMQNTNAMDLGRIRVDAILNDERERRRYESGPKPRRQLCDA
jgi:hypothetical protein